MSDGRKIFISYARKDGADLALLLHRDLKDAGYDSWLDTSEIKGGENWAQVIETAIEGCDVMLALLSKGSFISEICRAEQLRALRQEKLVIPLLVQPDVERPLQLEHLNYRDFSDLTRYHETFEILLNDISGGEAYDLPEPWRKTVVTAPPLPPDFIPRPVELETLRRIVIGDHSDRRIALTALKGLGGIGKSVLAAALCHDEIIQDAFPDGVLWVSIGREPGNLIEQMKAVGQTLGDPIELYHSEPAATSRLRVILPSKAVLIVLDNVWDAKNIQPFLVDAPRCRVLFTTRKGDIAQALGAEEVRLDVLKPDEAIALLRKRASREDPTFPLVAEKIDYLPLALKLVGARLRESGHSGEEWLMTFQRATQLKLKRHPKDAHESMALCFDLSVDELQENDRWLYFALGIFQKGLKIPYHVIARFWLELDPDMNEPECDDLLLELERVSLLERYSDDGTISLHDLLNTYNREKLGDRYSAHAYSSSQGVQS